MFFECICACIASRQVVTGDLKRLRDADEQLNLPRQGQHDATTLSLAIEDLGGCARWPGDLFRQAMFDSGDRSFQDPDVYHNLCDHRSRALNRSWTRLNFALKNRLLFVVLLVWNIGLGVVNTTAVTIGATGAHLMWHHPVGVTVHVQIGMDQCFISPLRFLNIPTKGCNLWRLLLRVKRGARCPFKSGWNTSSFNIQMMGCGSEATTSTTMYVG